MWEGRDRPPNGLLRNPTASATALWEQNGESYFVLCTMAESRISRDEVRDGGCMMRTLHHPIVCVLWLAEGQTAEMLTSYSIRVCLAYTEYRMEYDLRSMYSVYMLYSVRRWQMVCVAGVWLLSYTFSAFFC